MSRDAHLQAIDKILVKFVQFLSLLPLGCYSIIKMLLYPSFLDYILSWTGMAELLEGCVNSAIYPNWRILKLLISKKQK